MTTCMSSAMASAWANSPCSSFWTLCERPCGDLTIWCCVPDRALTPSTHEAACGFDEDMLTCGCTVGEILCMLDCGHGHCGYWYDCDMCDRSLCRRCFTQWPPGLEGFGIRTLWFPTDIGRLKGGELMYNKKWVHTGKGNAKGYWSDITSLSTGPRRTADVRTCGGCCGAMWLALRAVVLRQRMVGPRGDLPPYVNLQIFFRASQNSWEQEEAQNSRLTLESCPHCANDDHCMFVHQAMCHVGNHGRCHGGVRGCPCRCVSSTKTACGALHRMIGKREWWLHVIAVKFGELDQVAVDFSGDCPTLTAGTLSHACVSNDTQIDAVHVRSWGNFFREVVFDRARLHEVVHRSIPSQTANRIWSDISRLREEEGGHLDFAAMLYKERFARTQVLSAVA